MKQRTGYLVCSLVTLLSLSLFSCVKSPDSSPAQNLQADVIRDTAYGTDPKQKVDIYLPEARSEEATPVIFLIHGGAWQAGDKSEMTAYVSKIQAQWPECAIVNINYRLANGSTIIADTLMADLQSAISFISDHRDFWKVSDKYALMGASAGAQLALLYTYTRNKSGIQCVADLYGPCIIDDWSWYNSFNIFLGKSIKEVLVNYTGSTWEADSNAYHLNSPYSQLNNTNSRPTIIFHGNIDVIVPVYQSQWLGAKLKSLGEEYEYHEYALDGHGFNDANNEDCIRKIISFFKKHM